MRADITGLQTQMREVRTDIVEIRSDIGVIRTDLTALGRHKRLLHEDLSHASRRSARGGRNDAGGESDRSSRVSMLYMIVERFRGEAKPVYERFRDRGRLAPPGLTYVSSWVDAELRICFQVMETDDRTLIDGWIANWDDLVSFEVYPVIDSAEAARRALG